MIRDLPDLAVVIPTWNERENLDLLLPALNELFGELGLKAEVVIADAGSSDGTQEAAVRRGARVVVQREQGYGALLLAGFASTLAPYIVTMDADLSHRPMFLADLWRNRNRAEVLIASRYVEGGRGQMSPLRKILSLILNRLYARILSVSVRDLSSGFRLYRRDVLANLNLKARDFDILEEIIVRVYANGWRIIEVPFTYVARGSGASHARLFKLGIAFLKTLLRMWRLRNSVESADYDYRAFDSPIWLQRYWQRERHRIILNYTQGSDTVLDIGCGSSRIILDMVHAIGLDISQGKLRWLRPRHRKLVRASCERLPFIDESFSTVINSEVIEHVPDVPEIFKEMWRVLRPGGVLIVGTPDYGRWRWRLLEWVYGKILPGAYAHEHITHFTHKTLSKKLEDCGFLVEGCRYVGYCEMIFKAWKPLVCLGEIQHRMGTDLVMAHSEEAS
jgi:dolichol-phosphate mannosyltransferase